MVQDTCQGEKACVKRHDDDDGDGNNNNNNNNISPGLPFSPVSIILVLQSCLRPSLYSIILARESFVNNTLDVLNPSIFPDSVRTVIISVQNVNRPVSVIETECVYCALRLRYSSTIRIKLPAKRRQTGAFLSTVFAKEVNLNHGSGSFPAACDNQWPGLAWPVSYNFCYGECPRKPNCNRGTSLNMSRSTEGWLVWGGTWQPSLYELTPQYTDTGEATLQVQFRAKLFPTSPLVICALLYICSRRFVPVKSNNT